MSRNLLAWLLERSALGIMVEGTWAPGVGDPTIWGWTVTAGYLLGAVLSAWCALLSGDTRGGRLFWLTIGLFLLVLGVNKQLDFQLWLWLTLRQMARDQGWYEYRRVVQWVAASAVVLGGMALVWALSRCSTGMETPRRSALAGVSLLLALVALQIISLPAVDRLLTCSFAGASGSSMIEAVGIGLNLFGCAKAVLNGGRRAVCKAP